MLPKKISSKSVIMLFCGSTQLAAQASQAFLTHKIPLSKRTASTASAPPPMQSFAYIAFIFLEATVGSVAKKFVKLQSKT